MIGLKSFRDRSGYKTQAALAEKLGVGTGNVSKWEIGGGYPSYEIIKKLLELGATVEELFNLEYNYDHDLIDRSQSITEFKRLKGLQWEIEGFSLEKMPKPLENKILQKLEGVETRLAALETKKS